MKDGLREKILGMDWRAVIKMWNLMCEKNGNSEDIIEDLEGNIPLDFEWMVEYIMETGDCLGNDEIRDFLAAGRDKKGE